MLKIGFWIWKIEKILDFFGYVCWNCLICIGHWIGDIIDWTKIYWIRLMWFPERIIGCKHHPGWQWIVEGTKIVLLTITHTACYVMPHSKSTGSKRENCQEIEEYFICLKVRCKKKNQNQHYNCFIWTLMPNNFPPSTLDLPYSGRQDTHKLLAYDHDLKLECTWQVLCGSHGRNSLDVRWTWLWCNMDFPRIHGLVKWNITGNPVAMLPMKPIHFNHPHFPYRMVIKY